MAISWIGDQVVDDGGGRDNAIRRDNSYGHDMIGGGYYGIGRHCHDRIEVSRGQGVGEVADIISRKACTGRSRHGARSPRDRSAPSTSIYLPLQPPCRGQWPSARRRAHILPLGFVNQRALRDEVHPQILSHHLLLGLGVQADVAGDHLVYQLRADELPCRRLETQCRSR